jgi:CHAD domain-containing protein
LAPGAEDLRSAVSGIPLVVLHPTLMPVDQRHCRAVFRKLRDELREIARHSNSESVHKLRTSTRRVETVLKVFVPQPDRATRKLVKSLSRLRKKAGKVRDLDVQMDLLRNLKIARGGREKSQLLRALVAERSRREKTFAEALHKDAVHELRKRLMRSCEEMKIPKGLEPLNVARQEFSELGRDHSPITQKLLHQYRITGKRVRYVIEMARKTPETIEVTKQLETMQDVVGDWHDWLTLTERAENLFGGVKDSSLVAALRNLTRAKFREGVDVVMRTRTALSGGKPAPPVAGAARNKPLREPGTVPAAA